MPFTVKGYILYYAFLGSYNFNLPGLLLIHGKTTYKDCQGNLKLLMWKKAFL